MGPIKKLLLVDALHMEDKVSNADVAAIGIYAANVTDVNEA
jgi:hypothetical protein